MDATALLIETVSVNNRHIAVFLRCTFWLVQNYSMHGSYGNLRNFMQKSYYV